ncbi:hypothetical protein V1525DRAFT_42335 [Lipomyces kononenkoae]|uniref:Uncharacterized protein n=1 Tax=Lipomyces kononenkoae TaxID=34357 RepID=A0ACC3SU75_LIPKO
MQLQVMRGFNCRLSSLATTRRHSERPSEQYIRPLSKFKYVSWHVMKNVAYNVKLKWQGTLEGTTLGSTISGIGSRIRAEDDEDGAGEDQDNSEFIPQRQTDHQAGIIGTRLLEDDDRRDRLGRRARYNENIALEPQWPLLGASRQFQNDADGVLLAWKAVVYSPTEEEFWKAWDKLVEEFPQQERTYCYR